MGHHLSEVAQDYIASCKSQGDTSGTLRNKRVTLDHFVTVVGNIQTRNVGPNHVDTFFAEMQRRELKPGTLNNHLTHLRGFFAWTVQRKLRPPLDPTVGRRPFKVPERRRMLVPQSDFDRLLDCAPHPRDRGLVAAGLYLFLRQSEARSLRISDLDLDAGTVQVTVHKTLQEDIMPICAELDTELRRWLTWYAHDAGALQQEWLLFPAKRPPQFTGTAAGKLEPLPNPTHQLRPTRQMSRVEEVIKRVLDAAGYPVRDAAGKGLGEGMHTLRRSGARALYDELNLNSTYEGAGKIVQAMLHHKNFSMTEHYLQIGQDQKRRDDVLRGQRMFTPPALAEVLTLPAEGSR